MEKYDHQKIEKKWQANWEKSGIYCAADNSKKPKYYCLVEFPYPSGDGLHVGHPRPYIGLDIIARKKRMEGKNVLYPIGWDAFGLPTENYAIKTGKDPKIVTKENSDNFRRQIKALGISFDWSREINTTDPEYYKWTQWIFLKFWEKGLAYKAKTLINWCPKDKIGLANEEVVNDCCERCGTPVEQREKEQWLLKITDYADRLEKDLDTVDYLPQIKTQQRNWIGRREGAVIKFDDLEIFTTRPETIFGAGFIAIAGKEDKFTGKYVINPASQEKIPVWEAEYVMSGVGTGAIMGVPAHDERDFEFAKKHDLAIKPVVEPCFVQTVEPGIFRTEIPSVEREAILAIVKHWSEDKYIGLKWKKVAWQTLITGGVENGQTAIEAAVAEIHQETGYLHPKLIKNLGMIHSKFFHVPKQVNRFAHFHVLYFELQDGACNEISVEEQANHDVHWISSAEMEKFLTPDSHKFVWTTMRDGLRVYANNEAATKTAREEGILTNSGEFDGLTTEEAKVKITAKFGTPKTTYKLRDWVFSRQRYWGEPIPMIYCQKCDWQPVPEADLPVLLPEVVNYQPRDDGESPLASLTDWVKVKCPKCGGEARRETDVMPNWAGSSWYYLRYVDPGNNQEFASAEKLKYWLGSDPAVGGVNWYNGGMEHTTLHLLYSRFWHKFLFDLKLVPTAEPYAKRTSHGLILAHDGQKMSKSRGNVVNPDQIVELYGADTLRLYEMFMGPFDQSVSWSAESIIGPRRFLERVWKLRDNLNDSVKVNLANAIKKITGDIEALKFNTVVSQLMILVNLFEKNGVAKSDYKTFLTLLAPLAPHIAEELWTSLGEPESVHLAAWPVDSGPEITTQSGIIIIQVNGVVRDKIVLENSGETGEISEEMVIKMAKQSQKVQKWLDNKEVKKVVYIPRRLLNFVMYDNI